MNPSITDHRDTPIQSEHLQIPEKDGDFIKPLQPTMKRKNTKATSSRSALTCNSPSNQVKQARQFTPLKERRLNNALNEEAFTEMETEVTGDRSGYGEDKRTCPPSPVASHFDLHLLQNSNTSGLCINVLSVIFGDLQL